MNFVRRLGIAVACAVLACSAAASAETAHEITRADLISPAQLNSQLPAVKRGRILLIQVGFHKMYQMGHIPGSQYAGPAAKAEGLEALEKLVARLPRTRPIVIYCGCCPWDDCPNIRPAFAALRRMGFSSVKALDIPTRLGADWTAKGFPIAEGD